MILHASRDGRFQGEMVFVGYSLRDAMRLYRRKKNLLYARNVVFYRID
jgi:hypothetical protein